MPDRRSDDPPSTEVHQPGDPDAASIDPHPIDGDPPDAVGPDDDRSGGPEERAPDAPDT